MRVGITLPQFKDDPEPAIEAARQAEAVGLDGVFAFDHLWRIGAPGQPAIWSFALLGALAVETRSIWMGTLVARVGLVPNAVLVHEFETLRRMAGERVIAGLGTGDRLSRPENEAFDITYPPAAERRALLADAAQSLSSAGFPVWIGVSAGSPATWAAGSAGGAARAVNLWEVSPEQVAARQEGEVTWGGTLPADVDAMASGLRALADAGATWAVMSGPRPPEMVAEAAARAGVRS